MAVRAGRLLGFAIAGVAVMSLSTVPLSWLTVSSSLPDLPTTGDLSTRSSGLDLGWGWGMLPCLATAAVLGVLGGVRNRAAVAAVAAIPALVAVPLLVLAVLPGITNPTLPGTKGVPPQIAAVLDRNAEAALEAGWFAAMLLTLLAVVLGALAFALAARQRRPSDPAAVHHH
ncbi:hypothetical protein ABZ806_43795 [Spirillospora sp. NPDC047418]